MKQVLTFVSPRTLCFVHGIHGEQTGGGTSTVNGVWNSLADLQEECPKEAYPEARGRSVTREEDVMDMTTGYK